MNISFEFHDSHVRAVEHLPGAIRMSFSSAYLHHSVGRPGVDAGSGHVQPVEIVFGDAQCPGSLASYIGTLSVGEVIIDEDSYSLLPVPFQASGMVAAEFVFCNGEILTLTAKSISCTAHGPSRFVEKFDA